MNVSLEYLDREDDAPDHAVVGAPPPEGTVVIVGDERFYVARLELTIEVDGLNLARGRYTAVLTPVEPS